MVIWGLAIGIAGGFALLAGAPHAWVIQGSRASDLHASMAMLKRGGPLLVGQAATSHQFYGVGIGDDQGLYIYLPLLSRLLGVADPVSMLRYCFAVLFGLAAASYPTVFYRLTHSLLAGIMAPLMLLVCARSLGYVDIYWVPAWGMLALLPPLYLLMRDWSRFGLLALAALALLASWLSSVRSQAGLPILIAAVIVLLTRRWRWWRVLPALALLVVLYMSVSVLVIKPVVANRNRWLAARASTAGGPASHPLWSTIYLGLGYLPNGYGIRYRDRVALARVRKTVGNVPYLGSRYQTVLREASLELLRQHPAEIALQFAAKALVTAEETNRYLLLVILTMPMMLMLGPERRIRRRWVALTVPALIIMFLPSLIAVPRQSYEQGLYGAVGVLGILGLCWGLERAEARARATGGWRDSLRTLPNVWSSARRRRDPLWRSVRVTCAMVGGLVVLTLAGHFVRLSAERWVGPLEGAPITKGHSVISTNHRRVA